MIYITKQTEILGDHHYSVGPEYKETETRKKPVAAKGMILLL